jgi:hypothetical protein
MACTIWGTEEAADARETLVVLAGKSLLMHGPVRGDGTWTYRLHDLMRKYALAVLTGTAGHDPEEWGVRPSQTLACAHAALLERYRARTPGGPWHALSDDGYIHTHLAWHMEKAGDIAAVHALLREETPEGRNGWFEVCERRGRVGDFLADVSRAWKQADRRDPDGLPQDGLGLHFRYALITASINSLASSIPHDLLVALVATGRWLPAQGMAIARQIRDPGRRAESIARLADLVQGGGRDQLMRGALAAAIGSGDAIAFRLGEAMIGGALDAAIAIDEPWARAEALAAISLTQHAQPNTILRDILRKLADRTRRELPEVMTALLPFMLKADGHDGYARINRINRIICDVGRWWP